MRTFDPRTRAVKIIPDPLSFDRWDKRGLIKERLDCRMRSVSSIALSVPGINRLKFDCQEPWNVAHWQPLFQRTVPWCPIFPHPCTKPSTEMVLGSVTEMSEQVSVMVSTTWRQFCWHSLKSLFCDPIEPVQWSMGWNQSSCLLPLHETAMCVPFGCFLDLEKDGTLYHLLKQWSPVSTGYKIHRQRHERHTRSRYF